MLASLASSSSSSSKKYLFSYLQITEDKTGLRSEALGLNLVEKCDLLLSEFFGFVKIPFMLAILFLGHLIL